MKAIKLLGISVLAVALSSSAAFAKVRTSRRRGVGCGVAAAEGGHAR